MTGPDTFTATIPTPPSTNAWSAEDEEYVRCSAGSVPIAEMASKLGRSPAAIRNKVWRLGVSTRRMWSDDEVQRLRDLYESAGATGPLGLDAFAASVGRDKANVCRKAKELGLTVSAHRNLPHRHSETVSARMKEAIALNGHPRGMLGKKHTVDFKKRQSVISRERWAAMTDDERQNMLNSSYEGRKASGNKRPAIGRGSWKAAWREIGGKRSFFRSRWEANYARFLELEKQAGHIAEWEHEPETFWFDAIRRGVRSYKPDFKVTMPDGHIQWHEVKGWMDSRSRTTLKRMAKYYPEETVVVVDEAAYSAIYDSHLAQIIDWEGGRK